MTSIWFDPLTASWRLRCPQYPGQLASVRLTEFRRVEPLEGPRRPPVFRVAHKCELCSSSHWSLLTSRELDWDSLQQTEPVFWDLMLGKMNWNSSGVQERWSESIKKGHWPLHLWCRKHGSWNPGWPSLLHALEPDRDESPSTIMVHYRCPACQKDETAQMKAEQLSLIPRIS